MRSPIAGVFQCERSPGRELTYINKFDSLHTVQFSRRLLAFRIVHALLTVFFNFVLWILICSDYNMIIVCVLAASAESGNKVKLRQEI